MYSPCRASPCWTTGPRGSGSVPSGHPGSSRPCNKKEVFKSSLLQKWDFQTVLEAIMKCSSRPLNKKEMFKPSLEWKSSLLLRSNVEIKVWCTSCPCNWSLTLIIWKFMTSHKFKLTFYEIIDYNCTTTSHDVIASQLWRHLARQ